MKNYELLTVFKPSLDSEELDKVVEKITEEITSYQGSVVSIDKMGRKKLAYDVQGYRDGYFANIVNGGYKYNQQFSRREIEDIERSEVDINTFLKIK